MVVGQMTLDLSDNRLASFVDAVNGALLEADPMRYGWLKSHPILYKQEGSVSWVTSDINQQVNANTSMMPAHQVLYGIANAIEQKEI